MASLNETDSRVVERIDNANATATSALEQANAFLDALEQSATDIDIPYIEDITGSLYLESIDMPVEKPTKPDIDIADTISPTKPDLESVNIDTPNIPNMAVTSPDINLPDTPDAGSMPVVPEEPTITPVTTPVSPDYVLPTVPTFEEIPIATAPSSTIPEMEGEMPYNDLTPPDLQYSFSETEYLSSLLDAVKDKLQSDVINGGTGLSEDVEQAIFNRQRERDDEALQDAVDTAIGTWSARGFNLPDGTIVSQVDKLIRDYEHSKLDRSRDITIKQAELAQTNTHFAITNAINTEAILIQHADSVANRALTSARTVCEVGIALFNSQVSNYNTKLDAYKTQATVFETKIRGEVVKAELYRTQLEGSKLRGDLQMQQVDLYKAQLAGINSLINIYKTQMEASVLQNDVNRLNLEVFRSKITAYTAQLTARTTLYDLYKNQIGAEALKVNLYDSQLNAYNSELNGTKVKTDILTNEARLKIDNNRLLLGAYDSDIRKYVAEYNEAIEKVRAYTSLYNSDVNVYDADIRYQEAKARISVAQKEIFVNHYDNKTKLAMERAKANLSAFADVANIKVTAAKGGADVYASMANAALTAVSTLVTLGSRALVTAEETV